MISLRFMLELTPIWAIWSNGNTQNRVEYGWGQEHKKPAISPKRCKIGQVYYDRLIGSHIHTFDWYQNQ